MTKTEIKEKYLQERYNTLRRNYPYGFDVRQSDGAIKFFNRDYMPLQEDFIKLPAAVMKLVLEGTDQNGSQFQGFDTYWYYNDGSAPANFIGKDVERDYIWKMMLMGRQLVAYGFHPEMYFDKVYKNVDRWGNEREE